MMKNFVKIVCIIGGIWATEYHAQQTAASTFEPARALLKEYKSLYVINESDENKIKIIIKNINNVLEDPRLKGKLQVELLAFGGGVEIYKKTNPYEPLLISLKNKGVVMVQCENTLKEKNISKNDLFDFVNYTPTANGEMILRQYEGWAR